MFHIELIAIVLDSVVDFRRCVRVRSTTFSRDTDGGDASTIIVAGGIVLVNAFDPVCHSRGLKLAN